MDMTVTEKASPGADWRTPERVGYAHPPEVVGRSKGEIAYYIALAIAATADVAMFYAIASIIMKDDGELVIIMLVAGFTASSLTLAHFAGRIARDVSARHGPHTSRMVWLLIIAWVLLGVVVFTVRLLVAESSGGTPGIGPSEWTKMIAAAIMFGALYLASGVVAGVGEYLTRNPYRSSYRNAQRQFDKAIRRLHRSQPPYERAVNVLRVHTRNREREERNYEAAKRQRLAWASEWKRHAAIVIAAHLQSPSATDGMSRPDRSPDPMPSDLDPDDHER
ncbi:hypothetical protein ACTG9Q_13165 [Actinokineospora sp. 24-640]